MLCKTKILYFLNSFVRGGVEEHLLSLLTHLNRDEFEPLVVFPSALASLMKTDLEKINVEFYEISIRSWINLKDIVQFIRLIKKRKVNIVHSHLFFASMFANPIAKLSGVPITIETAHIRELWRKGPIKTCYFIDRFFSVFTDKIIAVSNAVANYLITVKGLNSQKIKVVHNGRDLSKFRPDINPNTSAEMKRRFSLNDATGIVGVIGRLNFQKGHRYFLKAIPHVLAKIPKVKFLIVGDGELRKELEDLAEHLGISKNVIFAGFQKEIPEIISILDILVLPSLFEGLPLVAIEGSAMAKPVIVTNVDGSPEAIKHQETGIVVPPKDPIALAQAMLALLEDKERASRYGENGRIFVRKRFNIDLQVRETERLYKSCLDERASR